MLLSDVWKAPVHDYPIRDEILFQYLPLSAEMDVLEIGSGSGYTAYRMAGQVRSITLVDIATDNTARLRQALRELPNVRIICADVCAPNLPQTVGQQFDSIFGLEVFEYLADPGACLKNLAAMLRRGGNLLLEFPNYPPPKSPGITHFRTREELGRLLETAGFGSWEVCALKLRPHARRLFQAFHERPLRLLRALRSRNGQRKAMRYDETWTFQHRERLESHKYLLHSAWALLESAMRLGGDCFTCSALGAEILNYDLLLQARR